MFEGLKAVLNDFKGIVFRGESSRAAAPLSSSETFQTGNLKNGEEVSTAKKSRRLRLLKEREANERRRYENSMSDNWLRQILLTETQIAYRGIGGRDHKQPPHHKTCKGNLEGHVSMTKEDLIQEAKYREKNIQKTRRWFDKPIRIVEPLLSDEELRKVIDNEKNYIAGRHHNYYGRHKIFAVPGNQQTIDAIFNTKLGVVPVFEEDRLMPDPTIRLLADAKARKKQDRLWAPIHRIKPDVLSMGRKNVRLRFGSGVKIPLSDPGDDLQQNSILDGGGSLVGSIATVTDLDERSAVEAYNMSNNKQYAQTRQIHEDGPDCCDSAAADRSLFSEFSIGEIGDSRIHVPIKMTKMRTLKGLDGKKVKNLKLESLRSKETRSVERKVIRAFNLKLKIAIAKASKMIQREAVLTE